MNVKYTMPPEKTKQEFLNGLPDWDGVRRIDTMLIDYLGARDSDYVREVSRNMMITAVALALSEEALGKSTPMLIGPSGCGKSAFIGKLASGYSVTVTGSVNGKKARKLSGNLLVEICESKRLVLEMIHRADPFLGVITVNHISEAVESRWVLPVHVGIGDSGRAFTAEQDEINQLWAETLAAYRAGEKPYVGIRNKNGLHEEKMPIKKKHPYGID